MRSATCAQINAFVTKTLSKTSLLLYSASSLLQAASSATLFGDVKPRCSIHIRVNDVQKQAGQCKLSCQQQVVTSAVVLTSRRVSVGHKLFDARFVAFSPSANNCSTEAVYGSAYSTYRQPALAVQTYTSRGAGR